jgi:hypothetical protein
MLTPFRPATLGTFLCRTQSQANAPRINPLQAEDKIMHKAIWATVVLAVCSSSLVAQDLKSGLQVGEEATPFHVKDCTSQKNKGELLCYMCTYGRRPVVCVMTRTLSDEVASLIKQIEKEVDDNKDSGIRAFVVMLSFDPEYDEKQLEKFAKKHKTKIPLTLFDSPAGPPAYKVSKKAEVTVMQWNNRTVKANKGFAKGKLDKKGTAAVIKDIKKILD